MRSWFSLLIILLLTACASVPRGLATTLADAGIKTTRVLGSDMRDLTKRLLEGEAQTAFSATWDACQSSSADACKPYMPSSANSKARRELIAAILLRAKAIDALNGAYEALKLEAEYDARSDLVGAVDQAIHSVNSYAVSVASLSGAMTSAAIIKPLQAATKLGAGLWANQKQRVRLEYANDSIAASTEQLLAALRLEADVINSLATAIVDERIAAQVALMDAKLVSGEDMVKAMVESLSLTIAKGSEAKIIESAATRTAVAAAYRASRESEVIALRSRYQSSIAALTALVDLHRAFSKERPMSLADVTRAVEELDAALADAKSKE